MSCQETVGTKRKPPLTRKGLPGKKKRYQSTLDLLPQHRGKMALSGRFCFGSDPNPEKKEIVDERGYLRASAVDFRDL